MSLEAVAHAVVGGPMLLVPREIPPHGVGYGDRCLIVRFDRACVEVPFACQFGRLGVVQHVDAVGLDVGRVVCRSDRLPAVRAAIGVVDVDAGVPKAGGSLLPVAVAKGSASTNAYPMRSLSML